jgi:hypothetical protein
MQRPDNSPPIMETAMRALILMTALGVMSLADIGAARATEGPWCLRTREYQSGECSIPTLAMCNFQALPENGSCYPNPNYRGNVQPARPDFAHRRRARG